METEKEKKYREERDYWKRKFNKQKSWALTMERHNDRLNNDNIATHAVLEKFRAQIKEICPHKPEWLRPEMKTKWGEETRHYCDYCHSFILEREINREI
jgi:hypothetical protein